MTVVMLKTGWGTTDIAGRVDAYLLYGPGGKRGAGVEGYLNRDSRSLACDLINLTPMPGETWGEAMDSYRAQGGGKSGRKRTFIHFKLSPDPKDNVTLEEMRELATSWAREMFGMDNPAICPAQVAIEYHDDNAREIMHAHIVVNNKVFDEHGGTIKINRGQWKFLSARAQELAWERGFRGFDANRESVEAGRRQSVPTKQRSPRSDARTMAERKMSRERLSWKQEIRDAIAVACNLCDTTDQVIAMLENSGIHCEPRRAKRVKPGSEWVFYYPQPDVALERNKKRVSSGRLGRRYTRQGIEEQIALSVYRRWAIEDRRDEVLAAGLVDVFRGDADFTLRELSDSLSAVNVLKVTTREQAEKMFERKAAEERKLIDAGRPTDDVAKHIRWLDAVIRTGAWVPDTWEDSMTAQAKNRVDAERNSRDVCRATVPFEEKIARGYRLTKEEHAFLKESKPALFREWETNRRAATAGRKRADSARSGTRTRQEDAAHRSSEKRTRSEEARARTRDSSDS